MDKSVVALSRENQRLHRCASGAYSLATNLTGEHRGKQGTEAVEPGGQEAQAEKEGSRQTPGRQGAGDKAVKAGRG